MKLQWLAIAGAMVCSVLWCMAAAQDDSKDIELWGGRDISMQKTASGAAIEFDCGHGNIAQPITPSAAGEFRVTGTYTPEMGGPIRRDNPPQDLPATYKGTISGDTMHLEVVLEDKSRQPPAFTLTRGSAGRLVKCR